MALPNVAYMSLTRADKFKLEEIMAAGPALLGNVPDDLLGTFPPIPSITALNLEGDKQLNCKEWFGAFMEKDDNLPAENTPAGVYLRAGDATAQASRRTEMISYICDHDLHARRAIARVGDVVRRLLERTLLIPQLLAENARLVSCSTCTDPKPGPTPLPPPSVPIAQQLNHERRVLMEQLAYMALQMKRLTDSLGYGYDPMNHNFYRHDAITGTADTFEASPTKSDEQVRNILGLDKAHVRQLWDALDSAQTNKLYGQDLNLYPKHRDCDGKETTHPWVSGSLTFPGTLPTDPQELNTLRSTMLRLYIGRIAESLRRTAPSVGGGGSNSSRIKATKELADRLSDWAQQPSNLAALFKYVSVESGSVRLTLRLPPDWVTADTIGLKLSSDDLILLGADLETTPAQPKFGLLLTSMLSLIARTPTVSEVKAAGGEWLLQGVLEAYTQDTPTATALAVEDLTDDMLRTRVQPGFLKSEQLLQTHELGEEAPAVVVVKGLDDDNDATEVEDDTKKKPDEAKVAEEDAETLRRREADEQLTQSIEEAKSRLQGRAINFYARVRPWLPMDQGATMAQYMQAGSHDLKNPNPFRIKAEHVAKNVAKHFSDAQGFAEKDSHSLFIVKDNTCLDFNPVFADTELLLRHGHELPPKTTLPKDKAATVEFNLAFNDGAFAKYGQPDFHTQVKENTERFMRTAWPNIELFFGTENRKPQNVIYVAYGASGAGKTQTTGTVLEKLLERLDTSTFSLRMVSDYVNRCYDFFSDTAEDHFKYLYIKDQNDAAYQKPEKMTFSERDAILDYVVRSGDKAYINAHALQSFAAIGVGRALGEWIKKHAKHIGNDLRIQTTEMTPTVVGQDIFREGNEQYAVGYNTNGKIPTAGINVQRDENTGLVDMDAFLQQFQKRNLNQVMDQAGINQNDTAETRAEKLWHYLESRVNVFRRRGNTGLNKASSRSHVVYILTDDNKPAGSPGSMFVLADFAGTEDLRFLMPPGAQQRARDKGYDWYSVATSKNGKAKLMTSLGNEIVNVNLNQGEGAVENTNTNGTDQYPAIVIARLAEATFKEAVSHGAKAHYTPTQLKDLQSRGKPIPTLLELSRTNTIDELWQDRYKAFFMSTIVMGMLPGLQRESAHITHSLQQFQQFLTQHRNLVMTPDPSRKPQDSMVDPEQFTLKHHKPNVSGTWTGFKIQDEPCLLVQKLIWPLVTPDASLVVLGAFAPRSSDDINSWNTAKFISDCQCGGTCFSPSS
jgi:hypothetical protein